MAGAYLGSVIGLVMNAKSNTRAPPPYHCCLVGGLGGFASTGVMFYVFLMCWSLSCSELCLCYIWDCFLVSLSHNQGIGTSCDVEASSAPRLTVLRLPVPSPLPFFHWLIPGSDDSSREYFPMLTLLAPLWCLSFPQGLN